MDGFGSSFTAAGGSHLLPMLGAAGAGHTSAASMLGPHFKGGPPATSLGRPPTATTTATSGSLGHPSEPPMDENRYRYYLYERESTWAEVEKLSGYISRYALAESASTAEISKEKYYDLFNIAVHLLKAIETLDPDRLCKNEPKGGREQYGQISSQRGSATTAMGQQQAPAQPPYGATHQAGGHTSPLAPSAPSLPSFPQTSLPRSMSPHLADIKPMAPQLSVPQPFPAISDPLANFPARGYMPEPTGNKPSPSGPMGIARYNQAILSGMLSMGQPFKPPPAEAEAAQDGVGEPPNDSATSGRKNRRRKVQRRDLHCHVCGVTDTPEWRRGPNGDHTLCNACGLHYAKALKKEKEAREKEGRKHSIDMLLNNQGGRERSSSKAPTNADVSPDAHDGNGERS